MRRAAHFIVAGLALVAGVGGGILDPPGFQWWMALWGMVMGLLFAHNLWGGFNHAATKGQETR